jgi:hypothetical protein
MTVAFPLRYKKGNPSTVLPLPSLACFRARQCRRSCFPLRLVFGQPATSPFLSFSPTPRASCLPSSSTTSRRSSEEDREKNPNLHRRHGSVCGDVRVPPLDACSDVPLHRRWSLSSFSFPCTHSSSTSSWTALRQWREHHVSLPYLNSHYREVYASISSAFVTFAWLEGIALILLSNLGTRFYLRGVGCDAPGFQPGLLTLMIRSTKLTLVKRRSTWAITSTSPTTPNDCFGQPW